MNKIDSQKSQSREYLNDVMSYRVPYLWSDYYINTFRYLASDKLVSGYFKESAGSLNQDRFLFDRTYRVMAKRPDNSLLLGADLYTFQNTKTEIHQNLLYVDIKMLPGTYFEILADSDTFKKWGDVGIGFLLFNIDDEDRNLRASIRFFSVDHYYNTKEDESLNRYEEKPYSWQWDFSYTSSEVAAKFNGVINTPLVYDDTVLDRKYQNKESAYQYMFEYKVGAYSAGFQYEGNFKEESYKNQDSLNIKSLKKERNNIEFFMKSSRSAQFLYSIYLGYHDEIGYYDYYQYDPTYDDEDFYEPSYRHREPYFSFKYCFLSGDNESFRVWHSWDLNHFNQRNDDLILMENDLETQKIQSSKEESVEAKYGLGFEWIVGQGNLFVNTTWDLDQIATDYPFRDQFSPWGGGQGGFLFFF